jgi:hypothetical protein
MFRNSMCCNAIRDGGCMVYQVDVSCKLIRASRGKEDCKYLKETSFQCRLTLPFM